MEFSRAGGGVGVDSEVRSLRIWTKLRDGLISCYGWLTGDRSWTARVQARLDREEKARKEKAAKSAGACEGTSSGATEA